jgi:hypothetical protein
MTRRVRPYDDHEKRATSEAQYAEAVEQEQFATQTERLADHGMCPTHAVRVLTPCERCHYEVILRTVVDPVTSDTLLRPGTG